MAAVTRQAAFGSSMIRAHARPALLVCKPFAVAPSTSSFLAPTSFTLTTRWSLARQGGAVGGRRWRSSNDKPVIDKDEFTGPLTKVKDWTFEDIKAELDRKKTGPSSGKVVFVDVREPSELKETGWIPGAINIPITSAVQSFHLRPEDFKDMLGYERPLQKTPIVVYCKAGVRARAAAGLAVHAGFQNVGLYKGSWLDWVKNDGPVSRETKHYRRAEEQPAAQVQSYETEGASPTPRASTSDNAPASEDQGKLAKGGSKIYYKGSVTARPVKSQRPPYRRRNDRDDEDDDEWSK